MLFFKNQSGVSIIAAIFIIVILAFMGMVFLTLFTSTSVTSINEFQSTRALYVAEGGLDRGIRYFTSPTLTERIACASIPATNTPLGSGEFSLTIEAGSPFYSTAATTLSGGIVAGDTTISVGSTAGYASYGRIMIDRELMDYTGITANSFTGILRGRDGTTAVSHTSGTRVGQDQCTVSSTGGVPSLANYTGRRQVREGVQIQEGWIVGNIGGSATNENINSIYCTAANNCWAVADNGVIVQWNGSSWSLNAYTAPDNLNDVFCNNANDCWAVGNDSGGEVILRWDGASWTRVAPSGGIPNTNLNSISCSGVGSCWAVGDASGGEVILELSGGVWSRIAPAGGIPNEDINGVYCFSTGECWAMGDNGLIIRRSGGAWGNIASPVTSNLNGVYCTATNNCWAVGNTYNPPGPPPVQEVILRMTVVPNWTLLGASASVPNENLNDVYCVDANNCWATGNNGTIIRWNGAAWSSQTSNTTEDLNGVHCLSTTDCWAVGDNGVVLHWDGVSWSSNIAPVVLRWNGAAWSNASGLLPAGANQNLNSISMLSYADGWVAGDTGGNGIAPCTNNRARILNWNGAAWPCNATSPSNRDLNSVSMVSANYGWAVGAGGSIVYWNGAAWAEQNGAQNITARELDSVHAIATNEIWITGRDENAGVKTCANGSAIILRYTGAWSCQNTGAATRRYRSIFMFPDGTDIGTVPDDGWIVGDRAGDNFSIYRWNNPTAGQWNNQSFLDATNRERLNSVYMLDTDGNGLGDDGWAVGNLRNNNLTILRWNRPCAGGAATGTWAVCSFNPGAASRQNLNSVFCVNSNDCWAVGNGGLIIHWDGLSWTVHSQSGVLTTADLNGVYVIGPKQRSQAMWREVFQ